MKVSTASSQMTLERMPMSLDSRAADIAAALHRSRKTMNAWAYEGKVRIATPHSEVEATMKKGGGKFLQVLTPEMTEAQVLEVLMREAFGG